ncbi:MAG: 2-methylthioadenine synthetase, partial [Sulfolobales archaeon]
STLLTKIVEEIGMKINKEYIGSIAKPLIISKNTKKNTVLGRLFNYKLVVINDVEFNESPVLLTDATFYDLRGTYIKQY